MDTARKLSNHLDGRRAHLEEMRRGGAKIIGYVPNGYMPVELIHASGAVSVPLIRGGDPLPVEESAACLDRYLDPFCRAQIGYKILNNDPLYQLLDLLIVPVTDNHIRAIADSWDFYSDVKVCRFGVPHAKTDHALKYYIEGLESVKVKLEELTGTEITDQKLKVEIDLSNKIKAMLRSISLMRLSDSPPLTGGEFIELNHACLLGDRHRMLEGLEHFYSELNDKDQGQIKKARLLLIGSTIAFGDSKLINLIEQNMACIVIEEFCEGLARYWEDVETNGNLILSLADCYFTKRIPDPFFRGAAKERFDYLLRLAKQFKIHGVVWVSLMYRDAYDVEGYLFGRLLKELNIPFLRISLNYDESDIGTLKTKIEAFLEIITQGRESGF